MILERLSKIKVQAFKNLVKDGIYTVDYAILEADKMNDKGKFQAEDYEELMTYLIALQKVEEETEVIENTEEIAEETENSADTAENTDDTAQTENTVDTTETTEKNTEEG